MLGFTLYALVDGGGIDGCLEAVEAVQRKICPVWRIPSHLHSPKVFPGKFQLLSLRRHEVSIRQGCHKAVRCNLLRIAMRNAHATTVGTHQGLNAPLRADDVSINRKAAPSERK